MNTILSMAPNIGSLSHNLHLTLPSCLDNIAIKTEYQ